MAHTQADFPLQVALYQIEVNRWPPCGRHIMGQFDDDSIFVYQAYKPSIAYAAVRTNSFHHEDVCKAGYSSTRMSWIKTNFLWMMYRSGWASKPGQERILAIKISRAGFEDILQNAERSGDGDVRLQWDPDHDPQGKPVLTGRRAIQLGLRGSMLDKFSRQFVIKIYDITDFVKEQAKNCIGTFDSLMAPIEHVYHFDDVRKTINADNL